MLSFIHVFKYSSIQVGQEGFELDGTDGDGAWYALPDRNDGGMVQILLNILF